MNRRTFVGATAGTVAAALLQTNLAACAKQEAYDVVVVGAGVVGCCTARELMRYQLSVLVLEAGADIAMGATRANSGIVHAGYDPTPGTSKAAYNVQGAAMFPAWQADLGFAYFKNGALVLAFDDADRATLEQLHARGIENGASETRVIGQEELRQLEPNVSPEAIGALLVPESGVCDPYGLTYGAAENAADNGAEFLFGQRVVGIECAAGAGASGWRVTTEAGLSVTARTVVNAAGINSDTLNNLVSATKLSIAPKRGEYHLFKNGTGAGPDGADAPFGAPFAHTMFQTPSEKGKGVLVGAVAFGNPFCGPNSVAQESRTDVSTTQDGLDYVLQQASRTWPGAAAAAAAGNVISNFAGLRASNAETGDFVIGPVDDAPGFFNAACIDSPGLASAPAIGTNLAAMVAAYTGAAENPTFNPTRQAPPLLVMMPQEAVDALVAQDARFGNPVCQCCHVSEGELVEALHRSLPVGCLDALKWRTGATMGPCQGGRCTGRILEIIARETGANLREFTKRLDDSALVAGAECEVPAEYANLPAAAAPEADAPFEKPRSSYCIPGPRPAGVYSAQGTIDLMAVTGCAPGTQAVIWGNTALAQECEALLQRLGCAVTHVTDRQLVRVEGTPRVEAAVFEAADGTQTRMPCDLLVVSRDMV
ncbi:MAG: FAD-dependent oxidoreductase [Coriobacteriia bacterium]|nr:FAD-dependent oxidoreductase [Coriobacteriia bacterium]